MMRNHQWTPPGIERPVLPFGHPVQHLVGDVACLSTCAPYASAAKCAVASPMARPLAAAK
uniref:hypothetical protein n=1 Tax=Nonomuraea bangladeshensis TaxID=404385 RepID=UPI003F497E10